MKNRYYFDPTHDVNVKQGSTAEKLLNLLNSDLSNCAIALRFNKPNCNLVCLVKGCTHMIEQSNNEEVRDEKTIPSTENFSNEIDALMKESPVNRKAMLTTCWCKEEELR